MVRLLLILGALLGAGTLDAAAINRCVALDGILVYTDQTCAALGIAERSTAPLPRRRVGQQAASTRTFNDGCAAKSPEGMRMAVIDALDRGDFNSLSGLYNFNGRSRWTAAPVVRRLERMARQSALEVELVAVEVESLFNVMVVDTSLLPTLRIVQYGAGGEGSLSIENFRLVKSAGCLWMHG